MPRKQTKSPAIAGIRLSDPRLIILSGPEYELIQARREASGQPPEAFDASVQVIEALFPFFLRHYRAAVMEEMTERTVATANLLVIEGLIRNQDRAA